MEMNHRNTATEEEEEVKVERDNAMNDEILEDEDEDDDVVMLLPTFDYEEITVGRLIGRGGFSTVREIKNIILDDVYNDSLLISHRQDGIGQQIVDRRIQLVYNTTENNHNNDTSTMMTNNLKSPETGVYRYVLKTLRDDLIEEEYVKGMVDLSIEIELLSHLKHPNIICMRGMSTLHSSHCDGNSYTNPPSSNHNFIILDRLIQTLEVKFKYWKKILHNNSGYYFGPIFGYCCSKVHQLEKIWYQRMKYTHDIAKAISYLHKKKIIYRDLKPDNIGFDQYDQLKLFDFGLAKNLKPTTTSTTMQQQQQQQQQHNNHNDNNNNNNNNNPIIETDSGLFLLTGNTGSLRYMAPEVALGEPYNLKADVYSFGILFWQICALQIPFQGFTTKMHAEKVVRDHVRPPCDSFHTLWYNNGAATSSSSSTENFMASLIIMPPTSTASFFSSSSKTQTSNNNNSGNVLINLMQDCWHKDLFQRPDFKYITYVLEQQLEQIIQNMEEETVPYTPQQQQEQPQQQIQSQTQQQTDFDTRKPVMNNGGQVEEAKSELEIV